MDNFFKNNPHTVQIYAYPSRHESIHSHYIDTWRAFDHHGLIYQGCPLIIHLVKGLATHTAIVFRISHLTSNLVALILSPHSEDCLYRIVLSRKREILQDPYYKEHDELPEAGQT
jgi:hypothetical protein